MRRLVFKEVEGGVEAKVEFNRPVRYVRHSPKNKGKIVRIELAESGPRSGVDDGIRKRESLQSNIGKKSPLVEVIHEMDDDLRLALILRFRRTTEFEIRPDPKGRSLTVFLENGGGDRSTPDVVTEAPTSGSRLAKILVEARHAMTAREYTRASALFELVLESKAESETDARGQREAKELLGLARERNGQLAHARGEYEEYLVLYPEGDGTSRVKQRLQALVTAESLPPKGLREAKPESDTARFDIFGDVALGYYLSEDVLGDEDFPESRFITDLDVTVRTEAKDYEFTGDLSLSHDHDFEATRASDEDLTRVITLSLEVEDPTRTYGGIIGRQTLRSSGVLGRFDGVVARGKLDEHFQINGVFGFPLERTTSSDVDTERMFLGSALDIEGFVDGLEGQIFTVGQLDQGLVDRIAIGSELSYVSNWGYARSFLDYDAYFNTLNLALVSSSIRLSDDTQLHTYLQTQTAPFLTASNALIGQAVRDLKELRDTFSKREIRKLAKDRTTRTYTATIGGSHWIDTELQMGLDLTYTKTGSTNASEGVAATPSLDAFISSNLRVTKNNLLFKGDISSASFRFGDSESFKDYAIQLRNRVPIMKGLYVNPRFSITYRDNQAAGEDRLATRTTTQLTCDWRDFRLELQAGVESESFFGGPTPDEVRYLADFLVRYQF